MRNFFGARHSALDPRPSQRGIALVITLILLSVTLVMALAFLAISNRERSSVTTTTDATTARLAAETALAQAESQIISTMLATTNPYNYGLIVSTNYINRNGFDPADPIVGPDPLNVNYDDTVSGIALTAGQLQQNIANLFLSPRVPVYIVTNQSSGATDFRFYLDLNRNGEFDTNGVVTNVDNNIPPNGLGTTSQQVGDPEWVGVLERPDTTHGPNNKFLSRYAFIALPVGNALDVNYIHNQNPVINRNLFPAQDAFFRNEGVGSWEINLAAFLTDLNTNQWDPVADPYNYQRWTQPPPGFANTGRGFEDALSILANRYSDNYGTLAIPSITARVAFINNGIDSYTIGNLMTNTQLPVANALPSPANWVGSDNINHFFTPGDFFDPTKTSVLFTNSLISAGNSASTYDRYTFYRMLSQLGTDSAPESGLMNVNYDNLDPGLNGALAVNGTASVTNFVPWTPIGFFTNAADRMLRLYTTNWFQTSPSNYLATYYGITNYPYTDPNGIGLTNFLGVPNVLGLTSDTIPAFGITNIPVLVNGNFVYSPAVNRVLQLAANMYDATYYTNHTFGGTAFPTVFQPTFGVINNSNVYIANFIEQPNATFLASDQILNIQNGPLVVATLALQPNDLVFGVPIIIGAKKGFPNFNEFYMENIFQLTRKLMVTRQSTNVPVPVPANFFGYYEQLSLSLNNQFGVELWNSYRTNYTRSTYIYVTNYLNMILTNDEDNYSYTANSIASGFTNVIVWSGYNSNSPSYSFQLPLETNFVAAPASVYRFNNFAPPYLDTNLLVQFETNFPTTYGKFPQPHWGLTITNNLQVIMVDATTGRLIDYVQLSGPNTVRDLTTEIQNDYDPVGGDTGYNNLWNPTLTAGVPLGIADQLKISKGGGNPVWSQKLWGDEKTAYDQMNGFLVFLGLSPISYLGYPGIDPTILGIAKTTNAMDAPYTPTATVVQDITWQANDPLVHYLASDLNNPALGSGLGVTTNWPANLGKLNARYMPWGGNPLTTGADQNPYNLALKDPLIYSSDFWDFPTNKFPTVGWLGRVHRGTPWQTVYLKATNILNSTNGLTTWASRTGDTNAFDVVNSRPTQDHLLFDLFTTAPNDNATHGQLSVNVGAVPGGTSLAAWSALFSGMVVPPTSLTNNYTVISPVGVTNTTSPLFQLVTNINYTRENTNLFPLQAFTHKGDILTTPQLTEQSPFLNLANTNYNTDEMYEWLPQQAMSLLRAPSAPRYVIYCYGQALKPAPNGLVTSSGPFFQMITNYQVVTESAARAVIRVEGANTKSPHIVVESFNLLPPD